MKRLREKTRQREAAFLYKLYMRSFVGRKVPIPEGLNDIDQAKACHAVFWGETDRDADVLPKTLGRLYSDIQTAFAVAP